MMVRKQIRAVQSLFKLPSFDRSKRKPPGQIPGTAIHTGAKKLDDVLVTFHRISTTDYTSVTIYDPKEISEPTNVDEKLWIQVHGLHDIDKLHIIWDRFSVHPLIREDIVNTTQRPKIEHYPEMIFIVMRTLNQHKNADGRLQLSPEQLSILMGKDFVLTFQESDDDIFEHLFRRMELPTTRLRTHGTDYLSYSLIDTVVDHYFTGLDLINEAFEDLEDKIVDNPKEFHLQQLHAMRRDLIYFRKSIWSLRDGLNSLIRDESPLISNESKVFFRDVYDHVVQIIDNIESSKEMVFSLYDMYMSGLSIKMNEVMKVLTIIATIFIPLTFVAGIYGMNFDPEISRWNMPELSWYYGYPIIMTGMFLISLGMLYYFRRNGWI